jgi:DHA1 family bicyclomycin/chloramphenicol resistance-like MFS transporter
VQQTLSVFLFTFAFMMLFYGTLSDSFGRRPVILTALTVYTLASIGAACAPSFGWLLVSRALQGLSAGAGSVIGQAIVQDRFSGAQAQRMMSHIMMVFGLAPAIAPVLGGWSLPRDKRQVFHPGTIGRNYVKVLRHPQFVLLSLALGLAFSGLSLYIGSASNFVMVILGLPETAFAWMFIPLVGGMVVGSAWGGKRAHKSTPTRMMWLGFGVMALGAAFNVGYNALFTAAVPWAVLPLFIYTFGLSVAMPAIQITALGLFPDNRGLASSMIGFIQMMSFALVSGLVAPLLFHSALHLALGVAAGLALSFGAWRLSVHMAVKPAVVAA